MCEGAPEIRATEGPAGLLSAAEEALAHAGDEVLELAGTLRQHVCLHPLHADVGPEFLDTLRRLSLAVDRLDAAEAEIERAGFPGEPAPVEPGPGSATWRAGFSAGALAQLRWVVEYARGRGWVGTAAAYELAAPVEPPALSEEAAHVRT